MRTGRPCVYSEFGLRSSNWATTAVIGTPNVCGKSYLARSTNADVAVMSTGIQKPRRRTLAAAIEPKVSFCEFIDDVRRSTHQSLSSTAVRAAARSLWNAIRLRVNMPPVNAGR
jgi:hypothetical protein